MEEQKQKKEKTTTKVRNLQPKTVVFVGQKPVMNYVIACLTCFNSGGKKVIVKARGRAIPRAVDTVELLRRAFLKDLKLQNIATNTEEVQKENGQKVNVSAIEIALAKP
jgi:DNA-binding protein